MVIVPTLLSLLRILLAPLMAYLFFAESIGVALLVFAIAAITDIYDGYVARKYGVVTPWGAFLDPIADKILIGTALMCFVVKGLFGWWVVAIIVGRDVLVTWLRVSAIKHGLMLQTSTVAKYKTFLQSGAILGAFVLYWFKQIMPEAQWLLPFQSVIIYLIYAVTVITAYTGIVYVVSYCTRRGTTRL